LVVLAAQGVLANDSDADNDTLVAQLVANVQHGSLVLSANGGFSYLPEADYCGADGFTYRAFDGQAQSAVATVSLSVACVNDPPVAMVDAYQAVEDLLLTVLAVDGVLANDIDVDSDELTAQLVDDVQHGSLMLSDDGGFSYLPDANYCGADGFTYRAFDGQAQSAVTAVSLDVACVNDPPAATGILPDRVGIEGVAIVPFATAQGFFDVDEGDELAFSISGQPPGIVIDPVSGLVSGVPAAGSSAQGVYVVIVTVTDLDGADASQVFEFLVEDPGSFIFDDGFED